MPYIGRNDETRQAPRFGGFFVSRFVHWPAPGRRVGYDFAQGQRVPARHGHTPPEDGPAREANLYGQFPRSARFQIGGDVAPFSQYSNIGHHMTDAGTDGAKDGKAATDWPAIERDYRIGQLTVREIARRHEISHTSITRRADKFGWTRDLSDEIRAKTQAALLRTTPDAPPERTTPTREDVAVAVLTNVTLVREHRQDIGVNRKAVTKLLDELHEAIEHIDEITDSIEAETASDKDGKRRARMLAAVALPSRAGVASTLATALKTLIPLERQAFNLDEKGDGLPVGGGGGDGTPVNLTEASLERIARILG